MYVVKRGGECVFRGGVCMLCEGSICVEGRVYAVKKGNVRGSMYVEGNVS